MFITLATYETFIYELPTRYLVIQASSLTVIRRGRHIAVVRGNVSFQNEIRLQVYEELIALPTVEITGYGYEVWRGNEKLYWYDSQPHPNDPDLAHTHPHHKHIPPDIKHNRIPAPGLSFDQPNLPFLIEEIELELLS